ncbi:hypothetical protein A4G20_06610 [Pasteurellaceae bacterium RH1A]|nr:hypothetical protein A4G20_06610 [Pasteurellaceae bacterium RH1A]
MMKLKTYLSNHITHIALFSGLLFWGVVIVPRLLALLFSNTLDYKKASEEIRLDNYEYVERSWRSHMYHDRADIYLLRKDKTYYAVYYFHKGKRDHDFKPLASYSKGLKKGPIFLLVHPKERREGKGTRDNPIRVFNYGFAPKEYVWDGVSYDNNVKKDFASYTIMQSGKFDDWVYNSLFAFLSILFFVFVFLMSKKAKRFKKFRFGKKEQENDNKV